ncbi:MULTISPECIES: prepilin-type N-terminal cleavage/methylation domain-containing protein [unclassified Marinovum]
MRRDSGFTLVEILTAFVIFAVVVAVVYDVLSSSLQAEVRATEALDATFEVRSVLARVGREIELKEGVETGRIAGGGEWIVSMRSLDSALLRFSGKPARLFAVDVTVSRPDGAGASYATRMLVADDG